MPLQAPKRTSAGYFLALQPPTQAPSVAWTDAGAWTISQEWSDWAAQQRDVLLGEMLSHGNWFSKPPRRDVLEPLFAPWAVKDMKGALKFFCDMPKCPGKEESTGTAIWQLNGLIMSATAISPIWEVASYEQTPAQDTISLFGDSETVDGEEIEGGETREIHFEEIEEAPPAAQPTRIRSREFEARKFMAKERVREARLKAQIAVRLARKEESRFYSQFGDLDDAESHFSEYDLTDEEDSLSESSSEVSLVN